MIKFSSALIALCATLASPIALAEPSKSSDSQQFLAFNVHTANPSVISDLQCQKLFSSDWTKAQINRYPNNKNNGHHNQLFDYSADNFRVTGVDLRGYVLPVRNGPKTPTSMIAIFDGIWHFKLNNKTIDTPVIFSSFFRTGAKPMDKSYILQSSYCTAEIKVRH